ncbi:MAG: thioredoxin domain-containing protein [Anaerolineae bacterium]
MASKKRKRKAQGNRRRNARRSARSSFPRPGLLVGVVVVALVVVAALVLLNQGAAGSAAGSDVTAPDRSLGAADAPVEVLVYLDYQCPYCKRFAEGPEQQLREEYVVSGQVRLVVRNLAFIGDESTWAAEAAACAAEQDRFWDYHDKLFAEQRAENSGAFSRDNLKQFAADLGLDTASFDQCLDSDRYENMVRDERAEAQRRRIQATPSILVNGQLIENGANYTVLKAAIEAALAQ